MLVDFFGYCADCTVTGRLELPGGRLTEMLEQAERIEILDARVLGLRGEPERIVARLTLDRADVMAVEASGPPPPSLRRIHMVRHPLRLTCGPYTFAGDVHMLPGVPALRALMERRSMVPLTAAMAVFERAGEREVRRVEAIIVNGPLIDVVEPGGFDEET